MVSKDRHCTCPFHDCPNNYGMDQDGYDPLADISALTLSLDLKVCCDCIKKYTKSPHTVD